MSADVSVAVVTFESEAHLVGCLEALPAAADGLRCEVCVVDNASSDGTVDLLRRRFPEHALFVNPANLGFAAAVNLAARQASAPALLLLNPDAVMLPGSLRRLHAELDGSPGVAAVGPLLLNADGSPQESARARPSLARLSFEALMLYHLLPGGSRRPWRPSRPEPHAVECLSGACLLMRRSRFEELGGLDERFFLYGEDVDLCLRARRAGHELRLIPEARVVHAIGGSAFRDRRQFFIQLHRSQARLLRKHHGRWLGGLGVLIQLSGIGLRIAAYSACGLLLRRAELRERAAHQLAAARAVLQA